MKLREESFRIVLLLVPIIIGINVYQVNIFCVLIFWVFFLLWERQTALWLFCQH